MMERHVRRISIIQGEHAVVEEPKTVIATLLGSCIAVCLFDPLARVGGMNHFLLGDAPRDADLRDLQMQRYGVHAMELLINAMMRAGAARERMRAQIYGGANIVAGLGAIGTANASFARRFVQAEGLELGHVDVGGRQARKVEFLAHAGKARAIAVAAADPRSHSTKKRHEANNGDLELFRARERNNKFPLRR